MSLKMTALTFDEVQKRHTTESLSVLLRDTDTSPAGEFRLERNPE